VRLIAVALVILGALSALGFAHRERRVREQDKLAVIAGDLAGRPVGVRCPGFLSSLVNVRTEGGTVQFDGNGRLDLLQRAREDVRAEVAWSASTPMPCTLLLLGRVERAEAALPATWKTTFEPCCDLVERDLLALRLVDEVLRVAVERLDPGSAAFAPAW
jgi:hypothetical protein